MTYNVSFLKFKWIYCCCNLNKRRRKSVEEAHLCAKRKRIYNRFDEEDGCNQFDEEDGCDQFDEEDGW